LYDIITASFDFVCFKNVYKINNIVILTKKQIVNKEMIYIS
jgi:hypothetical protein